jgi:hypothetical protein
LSPPSRRPCWKTGRGVGCTRVGGLDFGLRNPFAAAWGIHDRDGILWLLGEHFARDQTLAYHACQLPQPSA